MKSIDPMLFAMRKVWQRDWQGDRVPEVYAAGSELYRLYKDELIRRGAYPMCCVFTKLLEDGIDHLAFQGVPVVLDDSLDPMQFGEGVLD